MLDAVTLRKTLLKTLHPWPLRQPSGFEHGADGSNFLLTHHWLRDWQEWRPGQHVKNSFTGLCRGNRIPQVLRQAPPGLAGVIATNFSGITRPKPHARLWRTHR